MNLVNYTPFPHLLFESRTPDDRAFSALVLHGTFAIRPGEPLRPIPEQRPVPLKDRWRGTPGASSLLEEASIAPMKPRSDILVHAVAVTPGGAAETEWPVRVRVGAVKKDLLIRGPAFWQHFVLQGWRKTAATAVREVPVIYELAFGGRISRGELTVVEERNPFGTGLIDNRITSKDAIVAAPQIVALDEPAHVPGNLYAPQGLLPLPPFVQPRLIRAGTFDDEWRKTRWPRHPADFDYTFYNSAPPGMIYPTFLRGDEHVELVNLGASGVTNFRLPGYKLMGLLRRRGGELRPFMIALDTVSIDVSSRNVEEHRVHLTWRGTFWQTDRESIVEARLDTSQRPGPMIIPLEVR